MLTVQACQQHQLAVMHPKKAKLFPAATVPAIAKSFVDSRHFMQALGADIPCTTGIKLKNLGWHIQQNKMVKYVWVRLRLHFIYLFLFGGSGENRLFFKGLPGDELRCASGVDE